MHHIHIYAFMLKTHIYDITYHVLHKSMQHKSMIPATAFNENHGLAIPACITSGSLTCGGGENVPGIPGACATRNFTYLVRGPWVVHWKDPESGLIWNHGAPDKDTFTYSLYKMDSVFKNNHMTVVDYSSDVLRSSTLGGKLTKGFKENHCIPGDRWCLTKDSFT